MPKVRRFSDHVGPPTQEMYPYLMDICATFAKSFYHKRNFDAFATIQEEDLFEYGVDWLLKSIDIFGDGWRIAWFAAYLKIRVIDGIRKDHGRSHWNKGKYNFESGISVGLSWDGPVEYSLEEEVFARLEPGLPNEEDLAAVMQILDDRELDVIYRYYWLHQKEREIALVYNLTDTRINQIKKKALGKLRDAYRVRVRS